MRAAIDIGTNTVLLLIAETRKNKFRVVEEKQHIPRLGKGVDKDKKISDEAADRVIHALKDYHDYLDSEFPQLKNIVVTATSAVRDATNKKSFLEAIKKETGLDVRILSGPEEAEWTAAGALSTLNGKASVRSLIIDIGGGSTEVVRMRKDAVIDSHSFDMGSVRFTERFLKSDPPTPDQISKCREAIRKYFLKRPFEDTSGHSGIGVAGTCTSLAAILNETDKYDPVAVNGAKFTLRQLQGVIHRFAKLTSGEIESLFPTILKGRADIILAGLLILEGFMIHFKLKDLLVSTGGIRHGAILKTFH
ncbi:Ppx/GppA family phosphatase [Balneola sp. MJW-20]|uniref:Ppx/GppA phosphatase family protein n=1 Tax=Gracilimonas aurantiaca TaxID=3234185 RepID=UPI003465E285